MLPDLKASCKVSLPTGNLEAVFQWGEQCVCFAEGFVAPAETEGHTVQGKENEGMNTQADNFTPVCQLSKIDTQSAVWTQKDSYPGRWSYVGRSGEKSSQNKWCRSLEVLVVNPEQQEHEGRISWARTQR